MLATLLTTERLRALSGYAFERGQQYWREGRVLACALDEGTLDGIVTGGIAYHVRVAARGGDIAASCTCPVKMDMCKHAVALSLAYLARRTDSGRLERTHAGFATRGDLDAWVAEQRVGHAMHLSAERVYLRMVTGDPRFQDWLRHALARLCMRDVASREAAVRHVGPRGAEVAEVAYQVLLDDAAAVREGLAAEGSETAPPPGELAKQLIALRRTVRATAVPRRATGRLEIEPRTPAVVWREADRVVRDYGTHALVTRLAPSSSELAIECACKPGPARCTHALALLDATLALLADPERADEARALESELLRPGWSRALEELARFDDAAAKPRIAIEVWWQLDAELGSFALTPIVKKQLKRGGMSGGSRVPPTRLLDEFREDLGEQDLRVAEQLVGWAAHTGRGTYPSRAFLALAGHPRVVGDQGPIEVKRLALGFTALAMGDAIRLEPMLDGARISPKLLTALLATFEPGEPLLIAEPENGRCLVVEVADEARRMWQVLEKHGDAFPPESHAQLLDRLARIEGRLPIAVPQTLKGRLLSVEPVTVVRLRLLPDVSLELELFVRPGPGAPLYQPGSGPRDAMLLLDGERGYVRRRLDEETARARDAIAYLPLEGADEGPPNCFRMRDADSALAVVAALESPPAGLEVEWIDQQPVSVTRAMAPAALRVSVERKRDWFGITGDLKVESGRIELAVLLDAARRQQRFVRIDEQRWVELSKTLRERLQAVADQTYAQRGQLELSPGAVPAIAALEEAGAKVTVAPTWEALGSRLAAALKLKPKPPASLAATLRDYQIEGHAWLARLATWGAGACLADDMGLGKTVQTLALLLDRAKLGPALVLAPTSVAFNWTQEIARFAPSLRPILLAEQPDRAACLAGLKKHDVLIASYGLLVRDIEILAARPFATLVIDEAQALKNATTHRAKAARRLDAGFRVALSGTPLENHLGELWSLFAIVFPGLLGSWDQFRDRFASPIERGKDPAARAALARVLRPFLLRRTKAEVARELPSRTEIQVPVALSKEERALYEDARLAAIAELGKGSGLRDEQRRFQVLAALTRLRLLASHPKLYDPTSALPSSKLRRLVELLEELKAEGHRALVFSQFTSHLALVRAELERAGFTYLYLDGSTPAPQRAKLIEEFQTGTADLFLLSLKAGGTGINLTAADNVIHLDPWWNPAVEDQATDRAHRIGQTKPVTVYRLITHGTIEEQILAMHGDKRALFAGILEGTNLAARLGTKDLLALLG